MRGYVAAAGFERELARELGTVRERYGRLLLADGPPHAAWAQNVWLDVQRAEIASIKDASRRLRSVQRNWVGLPVAHHRRAALIQAQLPHVSAKPIEPYAALPTAPLGSWALIGRHELLYAPRCASPFPHGEVRFVEDRHGPPSRAYLKLWELFTLEGVRPAPGERVLDLGSAPGGWTWVLAELGCQVLSVDKAALAPEIAGRPNVEHLRQSAFALDPAALGPVDWLFSDVVCYPRRLLRLVERWRGAARRMVCTVKFQGETDFEAIEAFRRLGGRLRHLAHNRHELTYTSF